MVVLSNGFHGQSSTIEKLAEEASFIMPERQSQGETLLLIGTSIARKGMEHV